MSANEMSFDGISNTDHNEYEIWVLTNGHGRTEVKHEEQNHELTIPWGNHVETRPYVNNDMHT